MRKIRPLFAGAALAVLLMTGAYAEGGPEAAAGGLGALDISGGGRTFFSLKSSP